MSCRKARSPTSATVGWPANATPTAVDTTPSIPLAPRLARTRPSVVPPNHSTSRTGMEEATTRVGVAGQRAEHRTGHTGVSSSS